MTANLAIMALGAAGLAGALVATIRDRLRLRRNLRRRLLGLQP